MTTVVGWVVGIISVAIIAGVIFAPDAETRTALLSYFDVIISAIFGGGAGLVAGQSIARYEGTVQRQTIENLIKLNNLKTE